MKKLIVLTALIALNGFLFAQSPPCATDLIYAWKVLADSNFAAQHSGHQQIVNRYRQQKQESDAFWNQYHNENDSGGGGSLQGLIGGSGPGCRNARYVIPVVVHIVHDPAHSAPGTGSNISDAQVENQLEALNDAYANVNGGPYSVDTKIQFCLATNVPGGTGIIRHSDLATYHYIHQYDSLFALYNQDETRFLNIYVVSDIVDSSGSLSGINGYGLFPFEPGRHGITVRYEVFGDDSTCTSCNLDTSSRGKVLVHETGHYLGLYHPFEKSCLGIDSTDCHKKGDLCCDVPQSSGALYSCITVNTCTETYNGDPNDMLETYMSYATETCMNTFTPDQVSIMHATLEGKRIGLITPANQELADMECCLFSANFIADNVFLCGADSVRFQAIKYTGAAYHWRVVKNGITTHYYDTIGRLNTYLSDTGFYHVSLTVSIGSDSQAVERFQYIELKDCGSTLASTQGNWFFGEYCGLRFSTNGVIKNLKPYTENPQTINTYQGCISHSNEHGNLLFYGGGGSDQGVNPDSFFLYNKDHQKMLGGAVLGDGSSEAGGLVIPYPGDGTKFYLFTTSSDAQNYKNGIHYHVIDTTLDGGRGAVVDSLKNIALLPPAGSDANYTDTAFVCAEGITAIPKCNQTGYWLITVDNGYFNPNNGKFIIYSVDTNGVTLHRVCDVTAFVVPVPSQIKASPDGTMISFQGDLFKFDRAAGDMQQIYHNELLAFGTSFSPNSKLVYFLEIVGSAGSITGILSQVDLEDANDSSKRKIIAELDQPYNHLQLGPDGKIYIANYGMDQLGVIESPDSLIGNLDPNKCGFTLNGPKLKSGNIGGTSKFGLPTFVDAKTLDQIPVTISAIQKNCDSVFFSSTEFCSVSHYWDFGDGDTSSQEEPSHLYAKDSIYRVVFISDRGSDTLMLKIGLDTPLITGDTVPCDTSGLASYSISNQLDNVQYSWDVTGGTLHYLPGSAPNTVSVKWLGDGTLSVSAYQQKTGCYQSGEKNMIIPIVDSNTITASQVLCQNDTPALLSGSTPMVNLNFSYQWQSRTPGGTWQPVTDGDSQDYQPPMLTLDSVYYRRVIEISTCDFPSNEILIVSTILRNTISITGTQCIGSSPLTIIGDTAISGAGSVSYLWQYSPDSMTWYDMSAADTLLNLTITGQDSVRWYRRKAIIPGCISYSNEIRLTPSPVILKDLTTTAICGPGPETHNFRIEVDNPSGDLWLEFHHYKEISSGNWGWTSDTPVNYPDSFPTSVDEGDSVKIRVIRAGCEQYTQTVPVSRVRLIPDPINSSIPYPLNMTVEQDYINIGLGTPTVITASLHDTLQWLQSAGNSDEFFQWQKCHTLVYGGYTPWEDIPGANNDTLFLAGDYCDEGNYRVILRAFWEQTNSCIDFIPPDFASVSIPEYIWSKDGAADTAAEPNNDPDKDYWNSPDLWNCWKSMNCTTHESPEYLNTDSNQVRVNIRNTGQGGSGPFRVYLYWTLGGFYEKWPVSWHYDLVNNGFYNPNYGQTYPMGSEIDSIDVSNMPGFTAITLSAKWRPPYPGWYDTSSYYSAEQVKHPLCILSRIVTCDEHPYGMTINEIEPTGDNVINNNNIVTRNTEVQDSIAYNKKTPVYVLRAGNQRDTVRKIKVELENVITNFWTLGYFTVRFDKNIFDAWTAGGQSGANYLLTGDEFKVTKDSFYLDNIMLDGNEWGWMYVQFHLHPGKSITTYQGTQLFRFVQSSCDTTSDTYQADGGFNFLLNLLPVVYSPPEITIPESGEQSAGQEAGFLTWVQENSEAGDAQSRQDGTEGKKTGTTVIATTAKAYPNPTTGIIYFALSLESEREISIELYDGLGKKMLEISRQVYSSGHHVVSLDGSRLAPGLYLAKIKVNGEVKTVQVIITR